MEGAGRLLPDRGLCDRALPDPAAATSRVRCCEWCNLLHDMGTGAILPAIGVEGEEYLPRPQPSEPGPVRAGAVEGEKSLWSCSLNGSEASVTRAPVQVGRDGIAARYSSGGVIASH